LAAFPKSVDLLGTSGAGTDKTEQPDWTALLQVRDEVLKALEVERANKVIGGGLEAQVKVTAPEPLYSILQRHAADLRYLWIVSAVRLEKAASVNGGTGISVQVSKADGLKCERCWNYSTRVSEDTAYPTVCERCSAALKEIGGSR
jgi:isoleucyl-tRNA synthetase